MFTISVLLQRRNMRFNLLHEQPSLIIVNHVNDLLDHIIGILTNHHQQIRTKRSEFLEPRISATMALLLVAV